MAKKKTAKDTKNTAEEVKVEITDTKLEETNIAEETIVTVKEVPVVTEAAPVEVTSKEVKTKKNTEVKRCESSAVPVNPYDVPQFKATKPSIRTNPNKKPLNFDGYTWNGSLI